MNKLAAIPYTGPTELADIFCDVIKSVRRQARYELRMELIAFTSKQDEKAWQAAKRFIEHSREND